MIWKATAVWFLQLVTAVVLGGLRQKFLEPQIGEHRAHQIGTLIGCAAFALIIYLALPWLAPASLIQAMLIGLFWLSLALAFEFGFFHFIAGKPWPELLADYNLARGRLLVLLWLTVVFTPPVCFILRRS